MLKKYATTASQPSILPEACLVVEEIPNMDYSGLQWIRRPPELKPRELEDLGRAQSSGYKKNINNSPECNIPLIKASTKLKSGAECRSQQ